MRAASVLASTCFVSLAIALLHCGDDDTTAAGPTAAEAGTGSSTLDGGASSSGSTSSSGSSGPSWPPPSHAACDAPVIDPPVTLLQADAGLANFTGGIALAWSGKQAGLVYIADKGGPSDSESLQLQRLDHHGAKVGEAVNLSTVQPKTQPLTTTAAPSLLSDGTAFIACWALNTTTAFCASVPSEGAPPVAGLLASNTYPPKVAYDGATRVMVARGGSAVLDGNGAKSGDFASAFLAPDKGQLAARAPGFVSAEAYAVGAGTRELHYRLLDPTGAGADSSIAVDANLVAVGGLGAGAIALLQLGTAAKVVKLEAGAAPLDLAADGNADRIGAIATASDSYGVVWSDVNSQKIRYRGVSSAGAPIGAAPVDVVKASDPKLAFVAVDDGFLLAVLDSKALSVVHVGCP